MAKDAPFLPGLSPVASKPVHVGFEGGRLTSDSGILALAEIERRLGLGKQLARCIEDPRAPERVNHSVAEMKGSGGRLIVTNFTGTPRWFHKVLCCSRSQETH